MKNLIIILALSSLCYSEETVIATRKIEGSIVKVFSEIGFPITVLENVYRVSYNDTEKMFKVKFKDGSELPFLERNISAFVEVKGGETK